MESNIVKSTTLVLVDAGANNNKFYTVSLLTDGRIEKRWGRVGAAAQTAYEADNPGRFEAALNVKRKKGYRDVDVLADSGESRKQHDLSEIAKSSLVQGALSPDLEALIEKLVKINKHEIVETSGGRIQVDDDGHIATPVGFIQRSAVNEAERLLGQIAKVKGDRRLPLVEQYLTLVPQRVPKVAKWAAEDLADPATIVAQQTFLTQLRDSIDFYNTKVQSLRDADSKADAKDRYKDLFRYSVSEVGVKDKRFKHIQHMYERTRNRNHSARNLRLRRVYELCDARGDTFDTAAAQVGNVQQLWHGTRAFNVLSILRRGLYVPPTSAFNITGRMFGNGIYMSDQSTKSLNYSFGYWGGGASGARDSNCFMFLADVAMGHEFRPAYWNADSYKLATTGVGRSGKPFQSISVKGGTCNVLNNEMVVWNTDQIRLSYLVEFDA